MATGGITIPTSAICVSKIPQVCLGVRPIGSCGSVHSTSLREVPGPSLLKLPPILLIYLKGIVANFTLVQHALAAHTNMSVTSAAVCILPLNVIFVPNTPVISSASLLPNQNLPTPIQVNKLIPLLTEYHQGLALYLCSGFQHGFPIHSEGPRLASVAPNLLSAQQHPHVVDEKLAKELAAHRLACPFDAPPFPNLRISPLGVVPKKTPGTYRLIHHLSYPQGSSVNDGIAFEHSTVSYARIDDAIKLIKLGGRGCLLAKTDIQNAFRIIPIRPADYNLLGMCWRGKYYYDRCMPMGCSSSVQTFEI